jgi:CheY-like chemotaxis protein
LTYAISVLEISHLLDEAILAQLPTPVIVFRASDQVVVYANEMAFQVSGYSTSDLGKVSLWDLLVEDHTKRAMDEASKPLPKQATENGDRSDGFARFRKNNGDELNFWFVIQDINDADGHVRFRTVLAFMDYDQHADDENWQKYINTIVEMSVRRSAGTVASELNNALTVLQIALESRGFLFTDDPITTALAPLKAIGARLLQLASTGTVSTDQDLTRDDADDDQQSPATFIDLSATRVLVVDDDTLLLEALQDILLLQRLQINTAISTKLALECAQLFPPDVALIDLRLGSEDGRDLAKLLLKSFPSMKIIYMTGYAHSLHAVQNESKFSVLKKPFAIDSLIALIRNKVST